MTTRDESGKPIPMRPMLVPEEAEPGFGRVRSGVSPATGAPSRGREVPVPRWAVCVAFVALVGWWGWMDLRDQQLLENLETRCPPAQAAR